MNTIVKSHAASGLVYCVDLAKNKFQVNTFGPHGERGKQRTLNRSQFDKFLCDPQTPRGLVVMEACASSNHWARRLGVRGYDTKLVPPQFVAKQRLGNKTDGNDADAIFAVHCDKRVRPVPVKTLEQQDLSAWHCLRERLVGQRTQCINQARGLLAERGVIERKGAAGFQALLRRVNEETFDEVTPAVQQAVAIIAEQVGELSAHIATIEQQLKVALASSVVAQNLKTIFGIGLVTATAFAADTGGSVQRFADSRQFAASLGITPREHSSGQTRKLGPITKRGNPYLRRLLVQCAQTIVNRCNKREDALCVMARRLLAMHKRRNTVIIAVANHLARIVYAVIKHAQPYDPSGRSLPA